MRDDLAGLFKAQIDREVPDRPRPDVAAVVRAGRRRRTVTWIAGVAGLLAVALLAVPAVRFVGDIAVKDDPARNAASGGDETPTFLENGCPRSKGSPDYDGEMTPTSLVAEGTERGERWVLCARTATDIRRSEEVEGLCMNWLFGEGLGSGMDCGFMYARDGDPVPLDENYFAPIGAPEDGAYFGASPAAAASAELRSTDGQVFAGSIYQAPQELEVPFTFFTVFAEPFTEGALVFRDENGAVVEKRRMEHGLSQLAVEKTGEGEGAVVGYSTEQIRMYEGCPEGRECREPRPKWIDCGDECDAALAGAHITLVASPAEGSEFVGWTGSCEPGGPAERCSVRVDEDMTITARFEPT